MDMHRTGRALSRYLALAGLVLTLAAAPALAGGVAIVGTVVTEDGDHDGYADTAETVSVRLDVKNTTAGVLTGVVATLSTEEPLFGCLTTATIDIGTLAAGEQRLTDPFVFVTLRDRPALGLGPYDALSVTFDVAFSSGQGEQRAIPPVLTFDLDLDVSGGSGPSSFYESFESQTLGAFENDNIDFGKYGLAASDGYRCQYNDPDWSNSNTYGSEYVDDCHFGQSAAHADAVFWGLSGPSFSPLGGRAFTGFHSAFFGIDLGPPENWTTPMATLDAIRSSQPVHLDWSGSAPVLSMRHQVSIVDDRCTGLADGMSYDRGVVMAQLADAGGNPAGPWVKLYPHRNPYDHQNAPNIFNCAFDPIDDGSSEDDFFAPGDPNREYGPSSTCWPEYAFANIGESSSAFDPANIGSADGPGLQGQWGTGTWIESEFDLSRFRGRSVRLRFLATQIASFDGLETWQDVFSFNPNPCDDGWWIDDVTVTDTLTAAATVVVDAKDNSSLPGATGTDTDGDSIYDVCDNCVDVSSPDGRDSDGDGRGDACDTCPYDPGSSDGTDHDGDTLCIDNCPFVFNPNQNDFDEDGFGNVCDCVPGDPDTYPGAPEVNDGVDNQCAGDPGHGVVDETSGNSGFHNPNDKNEYSWPAQQGATLYQVARAVEPDFRTGCVLFQTGGTSIVDTDPLMSGSIFYYLNRPFSPLTGSWGQDSGGGPRSIAFNCSGP